MKTYNPTLLSTLLSLLLLLGAQGNAKTTVLHHSSLAHDNHSTSIRELEARVKPYLNSRITSSQRRNRSWGIPQPSTPALNDADIQVLARSWSQLSAEFRQLYTCAAQMPDSTESFLSPGGNFEIHYSIKGIDSVPVIDTYMFETQNWRQKRLQSNNIPDYIDEIAWALDSTWSMEVNRFNFNKPFPYRDSTYPSDKYKILIEHNNNTAEYGFTMPLPEKKVSGNGFSSYIVIRNEWLTFDSKSFGYDTNPIPAIQVTCAHEFFHAIQYAMSWEIGDNTQLDDFPLSWVEGSAVTMEELAFPDNNDYLQYAKTYFSYPQMSFFSSSDNLIYSNSLLLIYISTRIKSYENVDLIRAMHFHNLNTPAKFIENIERTAIETGSSWISMLNRFHAASYFTGVRADAVRFIKDAPHFDAFTYTQNSPGIQKINKNATGIYSLKNIQPGYDSLFICAGYISSMTDSSFDNTWAATALVTYADSVRSLPLNVDKRGKGTLSVPGWKTADECLVMVSNGFSTNNRSYDIDFLPCSVSYNAGTTDTLYPGKAATGNCHVILTSKKDLRCDLTITTIDSIAIVDTAKNQNLRLIDSMYSITYPISWHDSASLALVSTVVSQDTVYTCMWNTDTRKWVTISALSSQNHQPLITAISKPGIYGFFAQESPSVTLPDILVFPNPVHVYNGAGFVYYEGSGVTEALAYSVDGSLVYRARHTAEKVSPSRSHGRFRWDLRSANGKSIVPGIYTLIVRYSEDFKTKTFCKKILLLP